MDLQEFLMGFGCVGALYYPRHCNAVLRGIGERQELRCNIVVKYADLRYSWVPGAKILTF